MADDGGIVFTADAADRIMQAVRYVESLSRTRKATPRRGAAGIPPALVWVRVTSAAPNANGYCPAVVTVKNTSTGLWSDLGAASLGDANNRALASGVRYLARPAGTDPTDGTTPAFETYHGSDAVAPAVVPCVASPPSTPPSPSDPRTLTYGTQLWIWSDCLQEWLIYCVCDSRSGSSGSSGSSGGGAGGGGIVTTALGTASDCSGNSSSIVMSGVTVEGPALLIVMVGSSANPSAAGATFAGQPMTLVASQTVNGVLTMYYLYVPTPTTGSIVFTAVGNSTLLMSAVEVQGLQNNALVNLNLAANNNANPLVPVTNSFEYIQAAFLLPDVDAGQYSWVAPYQSGGQDVSGCSILTEGFYYNPTGIGQIPKLTLTSASIWAGVAGAFN